MTKNNSKTKMKTTAAILMVLSIIAMTLSPELIAQSGNYKNINRNSIATLKEGIHSENLGVRKSSIYMAGLYKIEELVDALSDQLKTEKYPDAKILIALSLYNIGDTKGMDAVKDLSENDQDVKVKGISAEIYRAFVDSGQSISLYRFNGLNLQ